MELAPAIAASLGVPAVTNCVNVELLDGSLVVTRPLFDGTMHAKVLLDGSDPVVVAIQKGITPPMQVSAKVASVQPFKVDIQNVSSRSRVLEIAEEPVTEVDISKADIVVAVGRGIGAKEKIPIMEELATALGGVMACSRPLVDVGWLPRERQVGASGKSVAPKVYIACGISGASQHLSGMSESRRIIAINEGPEAPIVQVAHYGVGSVLFEVVCSHEEGPVIHVLDERSLIGGFTQVSKLPAPGDAGRDDLRYGVDVREPVFPGIADEMGRLLSFLEIR